MTAPRTRLLRPERRKRWAALACAVWVLGFEAGPLLHTGLHDVLGEHSHGGATEHAGHGHPDPRRATQADDGAAHAHPHDHMHGHAPRAHAASGERRETYTHAVVVAGRAQGRSFAGWRSHDATESTHEAAPKAAPSHALEHATGVQARVSDGDEGGTQAKQGEGPLEHGQGSLAHRDLAALSTLPTLPAVPEAPFAGYLAETTHRGRWLGQSRTDARARAPPTEMDPHLT